MLTFLFTKELEVAKAVLKEVVIIIVYAIDTNHFETWRKKENSYEKADSDFGFSSHLF